MSGKGKTKTSAQSLIEEVQERPDKSALHRLRLQLAAEKRRNKALETTVERLEGLHEARPKKAVKVKQRKVKAAKHLIRVVIPDSHGEHIDIGARDAFINDLDMLQPDEIVYLGDHIDAGGTFSAHQRSYTNEMTESYAADVAAANYFLDEVDARSQNARKYYIFGNHEQHIERWAARSFESHADAKMAVDRLGPAAVLDLRGRDYEWFIGSECYHNLTVPGTIKLGKCHFTHGMSHAKHCASVHLQRVGANVVFGHVHRVQSVSERTVSTAAYGAWCPGTLAKLQPLYRHTSPTSWQHGYGVQFINASTGRFVHFNVPLIDGVSLLKDVVDALDERNK
jgi:hypothetical protein